MGLMAVRAYLKEQLGALAPVEEHRISEGIDEGTNLILKLPGQHPELDPLLVAALIELAVHWKVQPPRRPVWIVAFDQEEWGMLGSTALARELKASGQKLKLLVSLEMLAYTCEKQSYPIPAMRAVYGDRGDFIAVVSNLGAAAMLPGLASRMGRHVTTKVLPVPDAGRAIPDVRLSDHSSFWDAGYDAVMVTDTSFMRNPHYHQMSDTIDTLDLPFLAAVTEGLKAGLGAL
jgi:Zn-dependent M28 family amino/carboxypeptidase